MLLEYLRRVEDSNREPVGVPYGVASVSEQYALGEINERSVALNLNTALRAGCSFETITNIWTLVGGDPAKLESILRIQIDDSEYDNY